jgi:hypothetical protein
MSAGVYERRDPATGLAPAPLDGLCWDRFAVQEIIGTDDERRELCSVHGIEIDAVLAASAEFRRAVGGVPSRWMSRGEALHIARALAAVREQP